MPSNFFFTFRENILNLQTALYVKSPDFRILAPKFRFFFKGAHQTKPFCGLGWAQETREDLAGEVNA